MAIKKSTGVAAPQLDGRTKLSHHSLDALTHSSGCCTSHKCHSMVIMALQIYPTLLLRWFIIALLVSQAFLGRSVHQGYQPLIQATITYLSTASRNAHSLCSRAHSLSQSCLIIPRPCLADKEARHTRDKDATLGLKVISPSPLKPATMDSTWKYRRRCE